jgi:hypothetical protein
MKRCEYKLWCRVMLFSFQLMNGANKLERYITIGWKKSARHKQCSLLGPFVGYKENEAL